MNTAPVGDAQARRDARRAANGIVIVVAVAFIGASAVQIVPAVFGAGVRPIAPAGAGSPEGQCGEGVRSLALALDRAGGEAWSPSPGGEPLDVDPEAARQAFERGLLPQWNAETEVERACAQSGEGLDAWAALLRLRRAEEQAVLRGRVELVPLRREVAAHVPANLR